MSRFRGWLEALAAAGEAPVPPEPEPVDLMTLAGQFTALRHEVNLQTKATRTATEQAAAALAALDAVPDDDEALRPVLKGLIDARDALALAERAVTLPPTPLDAVPPSPALPPGRRGLFGNESELHAAATTAVAELHANLVALHATADRDRQRLVSIEAGYTMGLRRLDRALDDVGLEPMPAAGEPFDPDTMEAVGVDVDGLAASGTVTAEVRRGYLWRGAVFRAAQVKVRR